MTDEWKEYTVDEFADVIGGGTPSTTDEENFGGDIPWITPKDLSNYKFRFIERGERNITNKGLNNSNATLLPSGTVLLSSRAPVGYLAIAKKSVTTNQGFKSIIVHDGFDNEFIYYLLKANVEYLKSQASGTTFGELSGGTLRKLKFIIPQFPEQYAIAQILGSLDNKIELNWRMNATLEAMAAALFKQWFVDNEEAKGWEVGKLGEVIKIFDSKRVPLSGRERAKRQGQYPYYGAASILDYIDGYLFDGIFVLMAEDGSVIDNKDHPVIQYVWGKFWANNHAHVLQGANGICNEHLYLFLKQMNIRPYTTGAVQPKINQTICVQYHLLYRQSKVARNLKGSSHHFLLVLGQIQKNLANLLLYATPCFRG